MKIRFARSWLGLLPMAAALLLLAPPAVADELGKLCKEDAKEEKTLCKLECIESFHVAKDDCRNVDHECAEACRAARSVCLDLPLEGFDLCKESCTETKNTAIADCRATYDADTQAVALDECIDDAQIAGFICRDECREAIDRDEIRNCRKAFRACIRTCPKSRD